jgi:two-component sensor histidine kinase
MLGRHISVLCPRDREGEGSGIVARVGSGAAVDRYETVRRDKAGRLVPVSLSAAPIFDASGKIIGVSEIARDISERRRLEEAQRLLSREVNHRSRNLLAIVEAIIRQTANFSSRREFSRRISERLQALSANQDLLIAKDWYGVEMGELLRSQLGHLTDLSSSKVTLSGDPLVVTPMAAQALGLAFHELATNALAHGSLSVADGMVDIGWRLEATPSGPELVINWRETGGPAVAPPERQGFGTAIVQRITGQSLGGMAKTTYAPAGLIWELRAPATSLVQVPPLADTAAVG